MEDIDKEIDLFKRYLEKGTEGPVLAKLYAETVLLPFLSYCKEKVEQFSEQFAEVHDSGGSRVRDMDNRQLHLNLSEEDIENTWPERAHSIDTELSVHLWAFRGVQANSFSFIARNRVDWNRCVWNLSLSSDYEEEYTGRDLDSLKKIFNKMLRLMMKKLREIS